MSLDLRQRLLVPKEAILEVIEAAGENRNEAPTRVFVKRSAELRLISETSIRAKEASGDVHRAVRREL